MSSGWIYLDKKILNWDWYSDKNTFRVFLHLLLIANYEPKLWRGIKIQRGQVVTSIAHLSAAISVSNQTIRTTLKRLHNNKQINIQTTNKYTLITICKYDKYQKKDFHTNKQEHTQLTNDLSLQLVNGLDTTKEYKNIKNFKEHNKSIDNLSKSNQVKLSAKEKELKLEFEKARKLYPGVKRGLDIEFAYLKKIHKKTWRDIIPKLVPAINYRIQVAEMKDQEGEFFPEWAHFKTYIYQSKWTESFGEVKSKYTGW